MERNKILLVVILMIGLSSNSYGQTYDVRLVQTINGSFLDVDVQIGNAPVGFVLSTSTFVFNYNGLALSTPTKVSANDGPWDAQADADYNNVILASGAGFAGLTVEFAGFDDDNGALTTVGFTRVGTVRFTIINASLTPDLVWRNIGSNTQVFRLTTPGSGQGQTNITPTGTFIAPGNDPLPITLSSFTGQVLQSGAVRLDWTTISEIENFGFNVERKRASEQTFVELPNSFIQGHGTTNEPHEYTFTDATVTVGTWQYRLKQIDNGGAIHHTDPIQVDVTTTDVKEVAPIVFALLQNYPNPFNPATEIKFSVDQTARTTLHIYNIIGQEVATLFDDVAEAGQYYRVRLNGSNLASGVYFYRLQNEKKSDLRKMILMK